MDNLDIPSKCEECGKRKPTKVVFEIGIGRGFNRGYFAKFICDKCEEQE